MTAAQRLADITEACFKAGATEVVAALGAKDVLFFSRNPDGHWTTLVWIDAAPFVMEELDNRQGEKA